MVLASMNRGGLQGSVFEMDDRQHRLRRGQGWSRAGSTAARCWSGSTWAIPATVATLEYCGRAVTELNRARLVAMVEPFMSSRTPTVKTVNDLSPDGVIKSMHIAQGLGAIQRVHLAEAARGARDGAGDGRDHAAHPAARRRPRRRPGRDATRPGRRRSSCRRSAAWWSAGPCSTRRTTTSPKAVDTAVSLVRGLVATDVPGCVTATPGSDERRAGRRCRVNTARGDPALGRLGSHLAQDRRAGRWPVSTDSPPVRTR